VQIRKNYMVNTGYCMQAIVNKPIMQWDLKHSILQFIVSLKIIICFPSEVQYPIYL